MRIYLKLHFIAVAIAFLFGIYLMASKSTGYDGIFKMLFIALFFGFLMKAYDDYAEIQKGKKSEG